MNLVIVLPDSMREAGNNLACVMSVAAGGTIEAALDSFDFVPRINIKGTLMRWASLGPNETSKIAAVLGTPFPAVPGFNAASAQTLFNNALQVTASMLEQLPPDVSSRMVLAFNMNPQQVIAWLQMVKLPEIVVDAEELP